MKCADSFGRGNHWEPSDVHPAGKKKKLKNKRGQDINISKKSRKRGKKKSRRLCDVQPTENENVCRR